MKSKARLQVRVKGEQFLVEVFDQAVELTRQPDGARRLFSFNKDPQAWAVYDGTETSWDLQALIRLIDRYESALHDTLELSRWEAEGGNPPDGARGRAQ